MFIFTISDILGFIFVLIMLAGIGVIVLAERKQRRNAIKKQKAKRGTGK